MAGLLGEVYGYIDSKKRGLLDAFNNPGDALQQFVGNLGDSVNQNNDMMQRTGLAPTVYGKTNATQQQRALARALMAEQGTGMATAGMFVGKGSKTWNGANAQKAEQLTAQGVDPRKVWSETGTWKGPDGMWRQEIPDNRSTIQDSLIPKPKSELELATEYLHQNGVPTHRDILSADSLVSPMLKNEAMSWANNRVKMGMDKPKIPLSDAFHHSDLYEAYPDVSKFGLSKETGGDLRGSFNQKDMSITTGGGLLGDSIGPRSTTLHEIQHGIQELEGFAKGGNVSSAPVMLNQAKNDALAPLWRAKNMVEEIGGKAGEISSAKYIKTLQDLSAKRGIKPSDITNMSPWYEYSDQIRANLGPMPKAAGSARDEWLNGAASFMYQREKQKVAMPEYRLNDYLGQDLQSLKREYSKVDRQRQKFLPEAKQYFETERKFDDLSKLSDYEKYRRIAGEAEARATQARIPLTAEQRLATFPEDSYDVPMNQLIIRGLLGQ